MNVALASLVVAGVFGVSQKPIDLLHNSRVAQRAEVGR
jgi:hypothetical protein